jgi:hypothetical protein
VSSRSSQPTGDVDGRWKNAYRVGLSHSLDAPRLRIAREIASRREFVSAKRTKNNNTRISTVEFGKVAFQDATFLYGPFSRCAQVFPLRAKSGRELVDWRINYRCQSHVQLFHGPSDF